MKKFIVSNGKIRSEITLHESDQNFLNAAAEWGRINVKSDVVSVLDIEEGVVHVVKAGYDIIGTASTGFSSLGLPPASKEELKNY